MLIPLKNGVIVHSEEYGWCFRADVYQLPDWGWCFQVNNTGFYNDDNVPVDFKVLEIAAWFNREAQHGTMLVKEEHCLMSSEMGNRLLEGVERGG